MIGFYASSGCPLASPPPHRLPGESKCFARCAVLIFPVPVYDILGDISYGAGGLNLFVDKPFVQLIKHCHSTKQTNRSIFFTCLQRIYFYFSLLS